VTSEARNRVNDICLNVSAKDDVVFKNPPMVFFKLHYLSLGPTGLEGSLCSPLLVYIK